MNIEQLKRSFLENEFLTLTINGAFQHNIYVYKKSAKEIEKKKFREQVRKSLLCMATKYTTPVDQDSHIKNIEQLTDETKNEFVLKNTAINFGTSQKLLNLYLKYLWCWGNIAKPPHCPIDARIIAFLSPKERKPWTKLDREEYKKITDKLQQKIGSQTLADWELIEWEEMRKKQ